MNDKKKSSVAGQILKVDLTSGKFEIERPDNNFYRKYLGGSAMGTYYCLREMKAGVDPLGPDNVLVFAAGPMTGAPVSGASRFGATAKSPLTGCIADAQCGGDWGPELKFSGFDAVVIKGKAAKPMWLWIKDGEVELRDASGLWGKLLQETRESILSELGDEKVQTLAIGPAGENLVRFANVSGGSSDYLGRTGLGAVMGSKNLKAVACRGSAKIEFFEFDGVKKAGKIGGATFKTAGTQQMLREFGTPGWVEPNYIVGNLVARNFTSGDFEGMKGLKAETMRDEILDGHETCYACVVRCRKRAKAADPYKLDPDYGAPEFETIGLLGSNMEVGDIKAVAKASELCNAYGVDTISAGAMISYAAESFENGLIDKEQTGGLELKFGDADIMIKMTEQICRREGLGDALAEGMEFCIEKFGEETRKFAMHVKNNPFPAHMPQVKMSQALTYAVNPFGADHMSSEHDWLIRMPGEDARGLGLDEKRETDQLDAEKVRMVVYSQTYFSLMDTLCLCDFCWGPGSLFTYQELEDAVYAATGWKATFWELMKAGERRINLMRMFNAREGIDRSADFLPERMFEPMKGDGAGEGRHVVRKDFEEALETYYSMMNWSAETGNPTPGKLHELGLGWTLE